MIPRNTMDVATLDSNFEGETISMSIDENSLSHIMSVLTDLYSDTMMAVVREYSTNGRDSHIEAGTPNVPIEVTTPTNFSPEFRVRDFGVGLSLDDIRNVYSKYGASTKRGSDSVNGMLGLGAKSALTYTSAFTVVAVKDGIKNVVSVGRHEDGSGYMEVIDTLPSDAPSGVEIRVPVATGDVHLFSAKVNDFFTYWESGTVKINGSLNTGFDFSKYTKIDDRTYVRGGGGSSIIVMGGVSYPVPFSLNLGWSRFVYFADMGDAVFSPSRESLLTNKKNRELCDYIVENIKQNLASSVQKYVNDATSKVEAVKTGSSKISSVVGPVLGYSSGLSVWDFDYKGVSLQDFNKDIENAVENLSVCYKFSVPHHGGKASFRNLSLSHVRGLGSLVVNASAIVTGVNDETVITHSGKRTVLTRGLRELGYSNREVIILNDHAELSKVVEGKIPVVSIDKIREASREVLRRNRVNSPAKKRSSPKDKVVDVITAVDGYGTVTTDAQPVSGDGGNLVYLSRSDIRNSGTVFGYSSNERSIRFNSIMEENPDFKFVTVRDSELDSFLKYYPKAVGFVRFVRDSSQDRLIDRVVQHSGGSLTKDDIIAWAKDENGNPYTYRPLRNNKTIVMLSESARVKSDLIDKWARAIRTRDTVKKAFYQVKSESKYTVSESAFFGYVNSLDSTVKSAGDIEEEIFNMYPLLENSSTNGKGLSHLVQYIKAVDSGLIN